MPGVGARYSRKSQAHRRVVEAEPLQIVADDIGVELERVGADGRPIEDDDTGADGALGILTQTVDVRDLEEARRRLAWECHKARART